MLKSSFSDSEKKLKKKASKKKEIQNRTYLVIMIEKLNLHLFSKDKKLLMLQDSLLRIFAETEGGPKFQKQKYSTNLNVLLSNLTILDKFRIHLSDVHYSSKRYNPFELSAFIVTKLVRFLEKQKLIEFEVGNFFSNEPRLSRVYASQELRRTLEGCLVASKKEELIILRRKKGEAGTRELNYADTPHTRAMRNNLAALNAFHSKHTFVCDGKSYSPVAKRIFNNGSFEDGGRFYHEIQQLKGRLRPGEPCAERRRLKIDGSETCEIDYKGIHVQMLYIRETSSLFEGDVYSVSGFEQHRDLFKIILQIILNCANQRGAVVAVENKLKEAGLGLDPARLIDCFVNKHAAIKNHFFSGVGVKLQNLDAQIAEAILLEGLREGIVVVSVHDSFIVKAENAQWLEEKMAEISKKILGVSLQTDRK